MFESAKAKVAMAAVPVTGAVLALGATPAFAEGTTPDVTGTLTTLATDISNQGVSAITGILPAMGGLLAAGIVVGIGIKWLRKIKG